MSNSQFLFTLVALFAALFAIFNINTSKKENYSDKYYTTIRDWKNASPFAGWQGGSGSPAQYTAVGYAPAQKSSGWQDPALAFPQKQVYNLTIPRNMQGSVSPRINSVLGGMHGVRYAQNTMSLDTMPFDLERPLISQCANGTDCAKGEKENYEYEPGTEPAKSSCDINVLGSENQPIVYDRLMSSNMRSRLRGNGDYVRGDLMIVPDNYKAGCQHPNWFQVSVKPERDLNRGAMAVIGGVTPECNMGAVGGPIRVTTLSAGQQDADIVSFGI